MSDCLSIDNAIKKRERWEYIKSLKVVPHLFWDSSVRGTYNVGRNKAKRILRGERSAMKRHLKEMRKRAPIVL